MTSNDDYVLEILQEEGLLTPEQIEAGRETMDGQPGTLLDHLINEEVISEADALGTVAGRLGMDMISLADQNLPPQVISDRILYRSTRQRSRLDQQQTDELLSILRSAFSQADRARERDIVRQYTKKGLFYGKGRFATSA